MSQANEIRALKAKTKDPVLAALCEHVAKLAEHVQNARISHVGDEHASHEQA